MASVAQITANRANAQLSTGPTTPAGKARVSQNALRHGLTARHLVVRETEKDDFEALRADLLAELEPQGAVETLVFNELLHAAWNLHRFRLLEAEAEPESLDRISRYQGRAQRAFYRALQELRILQTNRALRTFKLNEEEEAEVPAIADINELTKLTQSEVTARAFEVANQMLGYESATLVREAAHGRERPLRLQHVTESK